MAPIIHTVNLRKVYAVGKERVVALNDVSISIENGEFCCIVGQSGSGKKHPAESAGRAGKTDPRQGIHRFARDERYDRR